MKRIVLLCNGGLSTGILVKKMKAAAERRTLHVRFRLPLFPTRKQLELRPT